MNSTTASRQTKYCTDIETQLKKLGHATNAELLHILRKSYPNLSATTVHRATARLAARGVIGLAPPDKDGSIRYDANITPHDHFLCNSCGLLIDANIKDRVIPILKSSIDDCEVSGNLTVSGKCKKCMQKEAKI